MPNNPSVVIVRGRTALLVVLWVVEILLRQQQVHQQFFVATVVAGKTGKSQSQEAVPPPLQTKQQDNLTRRERMHGMVTRVDAPVVRVRCAWCPFYLLIIKSAVARRRPEYTILVHGL